MKAYLHLFHGRMGRGRMISPAVLCFLLAAATAVNMEAQTSGKKVLITEKPGDGFTLSAPGKPTPLYVSPHDYPGVMRAGRDLQSDIGKVTGVTPPCYTQELPKEKRLVILGTLGKSPIINRLAREGKIDTTRISGKWESFIIQVVDKPLPGIKEALVIAGSDKRGTIYGIYELSSAIGVSPWYWWADVPVAHRNALYVDRHVHTEGPPSVKYRGIFLNDEHPDLTRWVAEKFGSARVSTDPPVPEGIANYNHEFYCRLFELILRLKGNYLWPAMWNNAFNEDDPQNPVLADEYGIVMGTSHQEPMLRAQKEWDRRYYEKLGTWNYAKTPDVLENFWREGIRRNKNYESIITMGLRGANDTEMAPGGPEANKSLLEHIVEVQRKILAEEMNPDVTKVPQMWCLYKEVQDYYNAGMRVPDDVTLLWAEDNWGNIRRVPSATERARSGGAGIYYHFDYHGGPRSYQWINTSPVAKIWDQMSYAKQYGADRIWIVNVGHFRGYELPMQYFMDLAWYNDSLRNDNMDQYTCQWARQQFGDTYAEDIADIITKYTRYNGRRKPELLAPSTYSLVDYNEAERVVADYRAVAQKAEEISKKLTAEQQDAFYQLVLFPAQAGALVNELYLAAARNNLYARQNRASANLWAEKTQSLFRADTTMMGYYNRVYAGGRWNHFMDQTHLGYVSWNDPPQNSLQHIKLLNVKVSEIPEMGVAVEGSTSVWPGDTAKAILPDVDVFNRQSRYIEVFNKGKAPFEFTMATRVPWIKTSETRGLVGEDCRISVSVDWDQVPEGTSTGRFTVMAQGRAVEIALTAHKPQEVNPANLKGFVESNGCVSMEAEHYFQKRDAGENRWIRIGEFGHTLSGMRATAAADAPAPAPGKDAPCLEYRMYLFTTGLVDVGAIVSPVLNFMPGRPVRYAISFDDEAPQVVTLVPEDYNARNGNRDWEKSVSDNFRTGKSRHVIGTAGYHTLKIWMVDPGVVIQKIVVNTGGVKPSYLGPPESYRSEK